MIKFGSEVIGVILIYDSNLRTPDGFDAESGVVYVPVCGVSHEPDRIA